MLIWLLYPLTLFLYLNSKGASPFNGVAGSDVSNDVNNTQALALGDVDGDNIADLVVGNANGHNIYKGAANGSFTGVAIVTVVGCSDETIINESLRNEPPVVWLTSGPPAGSSTNYRINFTWGGWDPDGDIAFYEYAITDNVTGVFNPADTADNHHQIVGEPIALAEIPVDMVAGDYNGDGITDLVVANEVAGITVLLGQLLGSQLFLDNL